MQEINKSLFISNETKKKLEDEILSNIQLFESVIEALRNSVELTKKVQELLEKQNPVAGEIRKGDEIYHLNRLSEYTLLIGLIWLDISTAFRIYINAKENYEVIYSAKQLIITINEGYKKIYNFITIDKNGNQRLRNRNQSFWVKDIGGLITTDLPHLVTEYQKITEELDLYADESLEKQKIQRDLSVHYDDKPSEVYDMLLTLDIESISIKALPFMAILSRMLMFSKTILADYNTLINKRKNNTFNSHYQQIGNLKNQFAGNLQVINILDDLEKKLRGFQSK